MKMWKRILSFVLALALVLAGMDTAGFGTVSARADDPADPVVCNFSVWDDDTEASALEGKVSITVTSGGSPVSGTATYDEDEDDSSIHYYVYKVNKTDLDNAISTNGSFTVTATILSGYDRSFGTEIDDTTLVVSDKKTLSTTYTSTDVLCYVDGDYTYYSGTYSVGALQAVAPTGTGTVTYSANKYNSSTDEYDTPVSGVTITAVRAKTHWNDETEQLEVLGTYPITSSTTGTLTLSESDAGWMGGLDDGNAIQVGFKVEVPSGLQDTYYIGRSVVNQAYTYTYDNTSDIWYVGSFDDFSSTEVDYCNYTEVQEKQDGEASTIIVDDGVTIAPTTDYDGAGNAVSGYTAHIDAIDNADLNTKLQELASDYTLGTHDYAAIDLYDQDLDIAITKETMTALHEAGWTQFTAWMADNDKHINYIGTSILKDQAFDPEITVGTDVDATAKSAIEASDYTGEVIYATVSGSFPGNTFLEFYSDGEDLYDLGDYSDTTSAGTIFEYNASSDGYGAERYGYYYNKSAGEFQNWVGDGIYSSAWVSKTEYDAYKSDHSTIVRYKYYLDLGDKGGTYVLCSDELPTTITGGSGASSYYGEDYSMTQATLDAQLLADIDTAATSGVDFIAITVPDGLELSESVITEAKTKGITIYVKNLEGNAYYAFEDLDNASNMSGDFSLSATTDESVATVDSTLAKYDVSGTKTSDVSFTYDGELPGTTQVTLDLSGQGYTNGETVYLYYNNESTGALELVGSGTYMDGLVTFTMTHFSDYAVANKQLNVKSNADASVAVTVNSNPTTPSVAKTSPKTGDAPYIPWILFMACGCGMLFFVNKKRAMLNK